MVEEEEEEEEEQACATTDHRARQGRQGASAEAPDDDP